MPRILLFVMFIGFITVCASWQPSRSRTIVGQVMDKDGGPVIGGLVLIDDTDKGTRTDVDGLYELKIPRSTKTLLFTHWVYKDLEVAVGTSDTINVIMEEDGVASPWRGFTRMKEYIQENLRYPKAAKKAKVEGKVTVEFTIHLIEAGDRTFREYLNFKIIESLGYGCDEEAIRLIREGPGWTLIDQTMHWDTIRYTIEFKLK